MKIAVAGTGSIGRRHVRNLAAAKPGVDFVFYRASGLKDAFSRALGAPVAASFEDLAAHRPDAMVIATPSAMHTDLLLHGIRSGLPVYVEKPVVTTQADLESVRAALDESGYRAASLVGCNLRFLPSLRRMKALATEQTVGALRSASFSCGQWLPDWRPGQGHRESYSADPARGGGAILDLIHEFDALHWICGALPLIGAAATRSTALGVEAEAAAIALFGGGERLVASVSVDYLRRTPARRYRLIGDAGTLEWDLGAQRLILDKGEGAQGVDCGPGGFDVTGTYPRAIKAWLAAIRGGGATEYGLRESLGPTALAIAARKHADLPPAAPLPP